MNMEEFKNCISFIQTIDSYIRDIDTDNIDDYEDFYPFINKDDINLYKDVDRKIIFNYTLKTALNSRLDISNKNNVFYIIIVSYILTIKYLTDCCLYKPYTFLLDFIREFDLKDFSCEEARNPLKKMIKIESRILDNNNFFSKNDF